MTGRSFSKIRGWLLLSCLAATLGLATRLPIAAQSPALQPAAAPSHNAIMPPLPAPWGANCCLPSRP